MTWRRPPSLTGGPSGGSASAAPVPGSLGVEVGFAALVPASAGAIPAATTALFGGATFAVDLTGWDQVRLVRQMGSAGAVGSLLGVRASLDSGATWVWLDDGTSAAGDLGAHGPQIGLDATGEARSAWSALHASVRGPVLVQFVTDNGNGVAAPTIRRAQVQGGVA